MKTVTIRLTMMTDNVKNFVSLVNRYPYDMDLRSGRYVVDAKSILGIFSIDLSRPITMSIYSDDCDDLLRDLFATWDGDLRESQLDDLTWLYLESAVYLLELPRRPVLSELRRAHADYFFGIQYKLSRQEWMAKNQLVYTMQADRWRTVQGRHPPVMTPYESRLAEALSPSQPPQPGQLKGELLGLFARFALFDGRIRHKVGLHLHLEGLLASLATKTLPTQMIKTDRLTVEHSGSVEAGGSGPTADKRLAHITLRQNAAEDRAEKKKSGKRQHGKRYFSQTDASQTRRRSSLLQCKSLTVFRRGNSQGAKSEGAKALINIGYLSPFRKRISSISRILSIMSKYYVNTIM